MRYDCLRMVVSILVLRRFRFSQSYIIVDKYLDFKLFVATVLGTYFSKAQYLVAFWYFDFSMTLFAMKCRRTQPVSHLQSVSNSSCTSASFLSFLNPNGSSVQDSVKRTKLLAKASHRLCCANFNPSAFWLPRVGKKSVSKVRPSGGNHGTSSTTKQR